MASAGHLRDLLIFLLDTGAQLSEATHLTWRDVWLDRRPRGIVKLTVTKSGLPQRTADRKGRAGTATPQAALSRG